MYCGYYCLRLLLLLFPRCCFGGRGIPLTKTRVSFGCRPGAIPFEKTRVLASRSWGRHRGGRRKAWGEEVGRRRRRRCRRRRGRSGGEVTEVCREARCRSGGWRGRGEVACARENMYECMTCVCICVHPSLSLSLPLPVPLPLALALALALALVLC